MRARQKIIIICGPTASGKSNLAVELARAINGEVISADSRQVYKGLNIGTGKITKKEMRGIPHHLLDVANPKNQFTASDFVTSTKATIGQIVEKGKVPIICGGTGFYIDALLGDKQIPEVPPNEKLRKKLGTKSTESLFKMLQKLDPDRAKTIDSKNPRRLIRAIEIVEALGHVPKLESRSSNLEARKPARHVSVVEAGGYEVCKIGIKIEGEELRKRIHTRLLKRMKQGMVQEAKKLHAKGLSFKRMQELGLEYKYLALFLQNKITKEEMLAQLETAIWHYAKRQMTWFKKDKNIRWLTLSEVEKFTPSSVERLTPKSSLIKKEVRKFLD